MEKTLSGSSIAQIPRTEHRTVDGVVNKGPCIVYDILLSGDGADADVDIYDGEGTNDELKFHFHTLSKTSVPWNSRRGTFFRKGIYLDVSASTSNVSITFIPLEYEGKQGL